MIANFVKWLLILMVVALILGTTFYLTGLSPGLYAATYALIASAVLFIRMLPGQGTANRWANFATGYTGSVTTFLAAWYWLESEGGMHSVSHFWIVITVFIVIVLATIITALRPGQEES